MCEKQNFEALLQYTKYAFNDVPELCVSKIEQFFIIARPVIVEAKLVTETVLKNDALIPAGAPLLQVISYASIGGQEGILVWITRVCKIVSTFRYLKVCRPSVLIYQTIGGAAFPTRQDVDKLEVEGTGS